MLKILLIYAEALNELENGPYEIASWDGSKTSRYVFVPDCRILIKQFMTIRMNSVSV